MATPEELAAASAAAVVSKPDSPPGASEESILERLEKTGEEPPKAAGEEKKPADEGKPPAEEIKAEEVEKEPDLEVRPTLPEDPFKTFREDGTFKAHPELRAVLGRHEAYSELGSVSDLRSLREAFPTVEDVEQVKQAAEQLQVASEAYKNDPRAFMENLKEIDELSFQKLAAEFPTVVEELDPKTYYAIRARVFEDALTLVREAAEADGEEDLLAQIDAVAEKGLGRKLSNLPRVASRTDPRDAELSRLRGEKDEREKADRQQEYDVFHETVNDEYKQQSLLEIEALVVKAFPSIVEDDKKDVLREAWDGLQEVLNKQPQTVDYVRKAYKAAAAGRVGSTEQKALIDFIVRRAKLAVPGVARAVITKWTRRLVSASNASTDKKRDIADKGKDAGGAAGAPAKKPGDQGGALPPPAKRRSEDEIMADLATQVPR